MVDASRSHSADKKGVRRSAAFLRKRQPGLLKNRALLGTRNGRRIGIAALPPVAIEHLAYGREAVRIHPPELRTAQRLEDFRCVQDGEDVVGCGGLHASQDVAYQVQQPGASAARERAHHDDVRVRRSAGRLARDPRKELPKVLIGTAARDAPHALGQLLANTQRIRHRHRLTNCTHLARAELNSLVQTGRLDPPGPQLWPERLIAIQHVLQRSEFHARFDQTEVLVVAEAVSDVIDLIAVCNRRRVDMEELPCARDLRARVMLTHPVQDLALEEPERLAARASESYKQKLAVHAGPRLSDFLRCRVARDADA